MWFDPAPGVALPLAGKPLNLDRDSAAGAV